MGRLRRWYYDSSISVIASGTASGGNGSTTLTDSSQSWTTNQWFSSGSVYSLYDSTANFVSEIVSNTATVITFTSGSPYQTNAVTNGDSYQIVRVAQCVDQPGRGAGVLLSGTTPSPTGSVAEILDPIYEWNDTLSSGSLNQGVVSPNNTSSIIANRDWYAESKNQASQTTASSPFGGTSGTGHGTLANGRSTCTTGVGYAEYASGSFVQLDICTGRTLGPTQLTPRTLTRTRRWRSNLHRFRLLRFHLRQDSMKTALLLLLGASSSYAVCTITVTSRLQPRVSVDSPEQGIQLRSPSPHRFRVVQRSRSWLRGRWLLAL